VPLAGFFGRVVTRTRPAPRVVRYAGGIAITVVCVGIRLWGEPIIGPGPPYLLALLAVLLTGLLFDLAAGLLSVSVAALMTAYFVMSPHYSLRIESAQNMVSLAMFVAVGCFVSLVMETMHNAMTDLRNTMATLQEALAHLQATERRQALLLVEYRHRTRNDLGSIGAILLLRSRLVSEDTARQVLREAAEHTRTLARIHTRMENAAHNTADVAFIDTQAFIRGLCNDLIPPVAEVMAEAHTLPTERAVQLGLLLNELVHDARYNPDATVAVSFIRTHGDFILCVTDDCGGGHPETMRAKMCALMAKQLRGTYSRANGPDGGTIAMIRFPVDAPTLAPAEVGH
jgi:two-component sensor histidine kinase